MAQDVADFHRRVIRRPAAPSPSLISPAFVVERFRFLMEELDEFLLAGINGDIVKAADGLGDIIYSALGAMHIMGLPTNAIWNAIHQANMQKVGASTERMVYDAVKPTGWAGPETEIAKAIHDAIV